MKKDIVFWLDGPPVCCKGLFDKVAEQWEGRVFYVCIKQIDKDRALIVSNDVAKSNAQRAQYLFWDQSLPFDPVIESFINDHIDDYHVFNGYKSKSSRYLKYLLKINKTPNIIIWAERPHPAKLNGSSIQIWGRWCMTNALHRIYARKYSQKVTALLPLGMKGKKAYEELGWDNSKIFPIIYIPEMTMPEKHESSVDEDRIVRFVYLGRFSSEGKGTDLLVKACRLLKNDNFSLEMVGGYGDYAEEVRQYISTNHRLSFGGTWPINEACQRLSNYDICIVPSRMEGWNVTVNEAISAGIGCIVTDEAVSDEMITASGAGIVTKASDVSIAEAMDSVMEDPMLVSRFKEASLNYRENATSDACARYFIQIIQYVFEKDHGMAPPSPPWLL